VSLPLILIVDDHPEHLTALGELLAPGHRVRAAASGIKALKLACLAPLPDLILLDVLMPDMDGYEVLAELRARPQTVDVPVIFLCERDGVFDVERGLMLGASDYVSKPVRPAVLLARVRAQIALRQARQALQHLSAPAAGSAAAVAVADPSGFAGSTGSAGSAGQGRHAAAGLAELTDAGHWSAELALALATLAEQREPGARQRGARVRALVAVLLAELRRSGPESHRLAPQQSEALLAGVPLHELGKLALSDGLLQRPDALDAPQWAQMRDHARQGASVIDQALQRVAQDGPVARMLRQASAIALHHHERWDGLGYPDGLTAQAIPLGARLTAVAATLDALTRPRVFRDPVPAQQALDIVVAETGRQFDPSIIDALQRVAPQICACLQTLDLLEPSDAADVPDAPDDRGPAQAAGDPGEPRESGGAGR
jgi:putative two-component system response regulator